MTVTPSDYWPFYERKSTVAVFAQRRGMLLWMCTITPLKLVPRTHWERGSR